MSSTPDLLRRAPASARRRVSIAAALGVVGGGVPSIWVPWQAAVLIGWDVAAVVLLTWIWLGVIPLDANETEHRAVREDPGVTLSELLVLSAGVALLAAVGLALLKAGHAKGGTEAYLITLGVLSVGLSWALVHTIYTLRYARIYYSNPIGGIDFNEKSLPTYLDFAYLALTIGMTFQVSDTNVTTKPIRRAALGHALLSFVFGAVLVALTINVVASLLH